METLNERGMLGGFLTILIGTKLEDERILKETWKKAWKINQHKLHKFYPHKFRGLIKLAIEGRL